MTKRLKPLIIGNWKMNPATISRAEKLLIDIQKGLSGRKGQSEIAIAPPAPFISSLDELGGSQKIAFVSQDVSHKDEGAHTGEFGVSMLRSIGVKASIVGHSERRAEGETSEEVAKKVATLLALKSTAIVCVGEEKRDSSGDYFMEVESQLCESLKGIKEEDLKNIVVAYEPVWAIGTGKNASPTIVEEMKLFIQKTLSDMFSREKASKVRVIYGGSVVADEAEDLLKIGGVDGFLIGGASLRAKEFVEIIKIADQYAKMV